MIKIRKSETADTRTCDFTKVTKDKLRSSSLRHVNDVLKACAFFTDLLDYAAYSHDADKFAGLDHFHADFATGFKETGWWDNHRKVSRHHLDKADGVPADVNLVDVLEHIADCVMAGMARSGSVYELKLPDKVLQDAFRNTVEMLKKNVVVEG